MPTTPPLRTAIVLALLTASTTGRFGVGAETTDQLIVDEPLGARYSLGMTLWHLGHNAEMIGRFHKYLRKAKLTPDKVLPARKLKPPAQVLRLLLDPELLPARALNGWKVESEYVVSGATDAGPTLGMPLHVPRAGSYRLWVRYHARPKCRGVTFLKLYRAGKESEGPICQPDEVYAEPPARAGPAWKDMLVELPAGDLTIELGHVTRWWHGAGGYDRRMIDCLYATEEIWKDPPAAARLKAMRESVRPQGIQRTVAVPLPAEERENWRWWQVRPVSWEQARTEPKLFALSRKFWRGIVDELAQRDYPEARGKRPNYRAPERQVVFNETWNMVANPVRARKQIETLTADVRTKPLGYGYVWHDVATHIPGLARADRPAAYGGWRCNEGCLFAGWGNPKGTVTTKVPVRKPGRYAMWVRSSPVNLRYTAPWFGTVRVDGNEQFKYHHQGKIPSVWMKMGEVTLDKPGEVTVEFTLDGAGRGGTYRRIYTLFLVDDLSLTPRGTVRPPWTLDMYRDRAAKAGAKPGDRCLLWVPQDAYTPLSQEVWADETTAGQSWPQRPVADAEVTCRILMTAQSQRAVQVCLRNLTGKPLTFTVAPGPLTGKAGAFPGAVTWRVVAFVPFGPTRQNWTPFFLMRRPAVTVPPYNVAGVWLTLDVRGVPPGDYLASVRLRSPSLPERKVLLKVEVSPVRAGPVHPVLVDGYTRPYEGDPYLRDFVEHGMKVWRGRMTGADMRRWGIRLLAVRARNAKDLARIKALGVNYDDWFCPVGDEPGGTTEEQLKPFLDVAKTLRAADPKVRISFNPGEAAKLKTFQILAPYCDFWLPYSLHLSKYWGGPQKWALYKAKPWMWYTTPCLWDKNPNLPRRMYAQIRQVPGQTGKCVGTAFFALNYPWRDPWDTAYEHIPDASTMGAVISRHGPVPTRTWEAIREAIQHADLAMLVRERLGVKAYEEITDPTLRDLVAGGTRGELIRWLEKHPAQ